MSPVTALLLSIWLMTLSLTLEQQTVTHSSILARKTPWTEAPGRLHTAHGVAESDTVSKEASCSPTTFQRGVHQLYQRSNRSPPLHCVILACRKALIKCITLYFSHTSPSLSLYCLQNLLSCAFPELNRKLA